MDFPRISGAIGIIVSIFGPLAVIIATFLCGPGMGNPNAWFPWAPDGSFSWNSNALSDIGVSKIAFFFNSILIITGILVLIFLIGFTKAYLKGLLSMTIAVLLVLSGSSISLIGFITEDYGVYHIIASLGYFIFFPLAIVLAGFVLVKKKANPHIGYVSIVAGIIALAIMVGALVFEWYRWFGLGFAVPEFLESTTIAVWTMVVSLKMVCQKN